MEQQLPQVKGIYKYNYNLSKLTWLKVGGPADVLFKPLDLEDLMQFLTHNTMPITVLGAGSNTLIRDGGINGVVIKLGNYFTKIEFTHDNHLAVGGGCLNFNLVKFCQAHTIQGLEFLIGIPGTVGGGIIMNAGAYGIEYKDITLAIEGLDTNGQFIKLQHNEINFAYRRSNLPSNFIITKAILKNKPGNINEINKLITEIQQNRALTQPIKECTGGSTFANPYPYQAWQLIDQVGLRGHRIGDASFSQLHCNFMMNHGAATAHDLETLGELARQKVFQQTGIMLEWEIHRKGRYA